MNILHLSTPFSWRGGEQQIAYLTEELNRLKIEQIVLCPVGSEMQKYCEKKKIKHFTFKKISSVNPLVACKLKNICRKENVDIVHAHDSHALTYSVMASDIFKNKLPIIINRRVDFPIQSSRLSIYKYNHSNIKKIICDSNKIKEVISQNIKDKSKLVTIHSGIDVSRFADITKKNILRKEFNISDDEIIVGNVAAIAPHKDYYTFVNTAEILLKENNKFRFFIIGDGPEKKNIEKYIKEKKLENKIIITGFRNDIPQILPELDLFLITSETEGLGTSIIEAFACKVPVVATNAGGIPEIVKHEITGLLAPVKDFKKLAENVFKILNNKTLRDTVINNAFEVPKNFSKEKIALKTIEEYKNILNILQ